MNWLNSKFRSLVGVLTGDSSLPPDSELKVRLEEIRESMLDELGSLALELAPVARRIRYATDVQTLWYLRGDMMAVLAAKEGETAAAQRIQEISALFTGVLPRGLAARSSPLKDLERPSGSLQ